MTTNTNAVLSLLDNLQIVADLEQPADFPDLNELRKYILQNPNDQIDERELFVLVEAFIKAFGVMTNEWPEGTTDIFNQLADALTGGKQKLITNAKVGIFNTLAAQPELCELLNSKIRPNVTLNPHCLRQNSIDLAVENNNVQFCLLGLKMLVENVSAINHNDRWKPLHDGIINLASRKDVDITAIIEFLRARKKEVGYLHWNSYEGELLTAIYTAQQESEPMSKDSYLGWGWRQKRNLCSGSEIPSTVDTANTSNQLPRAKP